MPMWPVTSIDPLDPAGSRGLASAGPSAVALATANAFPASLIPSSAAALATADPSAAALATANAFPATLGHALARSRLLTRPETPAGAAAPTTGAAAPATASPTAAPASEPAAADAPATTLDRLPVRPLLLTNAPTTAPSTAAPVTRAPSAPGALAAGRSCLGGNGASGKSPPGAGPLSEPAGAPGAATCGSASSHTGLPFCTRCSQTFSNSASASTTSCCVGLGFECNFDLSPPSCCNHIQSKTRINACSMVSFSLGPFHVLLKDARGSAPAYLPSHCRIVRLHTIYTPGILHCPGTKRLMHPGVKFSCRPIKLACLLGLPAGSSAASGSGGASS